MDFNEYLTESLKSMTFGEMPDFEEFKAAFEKEVPGATYSIEAGPVAKGKIKEVEGEYDVKALYDLVGKLKDDWEEDEEGEDSGARIAGDIMGTLGFEWI